MASDEGVVRGKKLVMDALSQLALRACRSQARIQYRESDCVTRGETGLSFFSFLEKFQGIKKKCENLISSYKKNAYLRYL